MPSLIVSNDGEGVRVDRHLRRVGFYFPQNLFEKWSRQGKLVLNGAKAKASARLREGDTLSFPDDAIPLPPPEEITPLSLTQQEAEVLVHSMGVFEDDAILVLNKPSGLATQGGTGQKISVDNLLKACSPSQRLRLTHRIDKETSGLLLIAKNLQTATALTNAFRDRRVRKTYMAVCKGIFENKHGLIDSPLGRSESALEKMSTSGKKVREALTYFDVIEEKKGLVWVVLSPKTGRTHQLRVHMSDLGHPILGDRKYGGPSAKRLMLHAWKIEFTLHGKDYAFEAQLPSEF